MACNCINEIDTKLAAEHHLRLDTSICLIGGGLVSATYSRLIRLDTGKEETRSRKPRLFGHTYCPFCGVRSIPEPAVPAEGDAR